MLNADKVSFLMGYIARVLSTRLCVIPLSASVIHLEEFGISGAFLNRTYQSIIIVVDILLVDAADPEDIKLWYVEDEGPRFPVVDPDSARLLMREWKALRTNQTYVVMDAMDKTVKKHVSFDPRSEKVMVVVHWIGMDGNSQAYININARVYYRVSLSLCDAFYLLTG